MVFKVLIVDDELIMREAYRKLYDWEGNGFKLIGSARDGREGLEMVRNKDVDIVITDLKMPVMMGLEFIKLAKMEKPEIKFIIMSGYDEFHLVNEAYKLGVHDYFLKLEMVPKKVFAVLYELKEEIKHERNKKKEEAEQRLFQFKQREKLLNFENIIYNNRQILREKLLREMLWSTKMDDIVRKMQEADMHICQRSVCVMLITFERYYITEKEEWNEDRELLKFGIMNVMEEICSEFGDIYGFCNLPHEYVLVFSKENVKKYQDSNGLLTDLFEQIKYSMQACFSLTANGSVADFMDGYGSVRLLYQQACLAREYKFIRGGGTLISYSDICECRKTFEASDIVEQFKKMLLRAVDARQILSRIDNFHLSGEDIIPQDMAKLKDLFYIFNYEISNFAKQKDLFEYKELGTLLLEYTEELKDYGTLQELNRWLRKVLIAVADGMGYVGIVGKVQSFIKGNYSKNISLVDVAAHFEISDSHLSRLFKKITGESFSDYLLNARMEAALELMKDTNLKIYEIANRVGFMNAEHFSRVFKKTIGKSPKEFLK